jgi:hypothetical protein
MKCIYALVGRVRLFVPTNSNPNEQDLDGNVHHIPTAGSPIMEPLRPVMPPVC